MGDGDGGSIDLLVVDDNPADIRFITEAFENSELDPSIHSVTTSDAALDFVYQRGEYADASEPDAVFLDWHLAQTNAEDVLEALTTDFSAIPVALMTGSTSRADPDRPSFSEADTSMEKPTEPEEYVEALRSLYRS